MFFSENIPILSILIPQLSAKLLINTDKYSKTLRLPTVTSRDVCIVSRKTILARFMLIGD